MRSPPSCALCVEDGTGSGGASGDREVAGNVVRAPSGFHARARGGGGRARASEGTRCGRLR
jgi:hypothetical protein